MKTIATLLLCLSCAGSAMAGNLTAAAPEAEPGTAALASQDWSGFYAGAFKARADGDMYDFGGPFLLNDDGGFAGLFGGYRRDLGRFVVGGELALTTSVDLYQADFPHWQFTKLADVKATAGYKLGKALLYVSAGLTTSDFETPNDYTYSGWNAGVGVDFKVNDRVMFGAELVRRSLSRTDLDSWTGDFDSLQVRAAVTF